MGLGSLNLTPLRLANVPPPMCHLSLPLGFVPKDTAISPNGSLVAALDCEKIAVIRWKFRSRSPEPVTEHHQLPGENYHIRQIVFSDENTIFALGNDKDSHSIVLALSLHDGSIKKALYDTEVSLICALVGDQSVVCQKRTGNVFIHRLSTDEDSDVCTLPLFCSTMVGVRHEEDVSCTCC